MHSIVIVGGGMAGLYSAIALRKYGYSGALTLVGAEAHRPYDRPPLSKDVLHGQGVTDPTLPADWDNLGVDLRLGCTATGLRGGLLDTDAGELPYDGLVIATGASARTLPGDTTSIALRTIDDARRLQEAMWPGAQVVLLGAGWIGAEVATAAVGMGCLVTGVELAAAPLSGALPPELGQMAARWWADEGAELRTSTRVAAVDDNGDGSATVRLDDGEELYADVVVAGIGARPATGWLAGSEVRLVEGGAVEADAALRTSMPGVVVVGDAASWESARYGTRLHIEHWDNALAGPDVAAATLLADAGLRAEEPGIFDPVPYFWSEQFGRMVQVVGYPPGGDRLVWRGSPDDATVSAGWFTGERLVAYFSVDKPKESREARRLLEEADGRGPVVNADRFGDPGVPLAEVQAG